MSDASSVLPHNSLTSSPERSIHSHRRQRSNSDRIISSQHQAQRSVDIPLLSSQHPLQPPLIGEGVTIANVSPSEALQNPSILPPLPSDRYYGARRNKSRESFSFVEATRLYSDMSSYPDSFIASPLDADGADELGAVKGTSMAGVGTASRTNKISRDSALLNRDSLGSMGEGSKPIRLEPGVDGQYAGPPSNWSMQRR